MSRTCLGCREDFIPRNNVPSQRYCGRKECQRKRRSDWQRRKMAEDADYWEHQEKARKNWKEHHRDYMRRYRQSHPTYRERENRQRRERRQRAAGVGVTADMQCAVNMDVCMSEKLATPIESGYFRVCRVGAGSAVKMDECLCGSLVQLVVVKEDRALIPAQVGAP